MENLQDLYERHERYVELEKTALAGGEGAADAHEALIAAVPQGVVYHFKKNAEGDHNSYRVLGIFVEKAQDGTDHYFVRYVPLYENPSLPEYRRLLVGTAEGEEDGWLLPVEKPDYHGMRFATDPSLFL